MDNSVSIYLCFCFNLESSFNFTSPSLLSLFHSFFEGIIESPILGTTLVAFVNVLATWVALKLMDSTERRLLILWSAGGMLVSTVFIILALHGLTYNLVALVAVMAFVSFFEIGLGPIPWLIVAEMFDSKYVATAMSMACIFNWGCNFLVGLLFPFIQVSQMLVFLCVN